MLKACTAALLAAAILAAPAIAKPRQGDLPKGPWRLWRMFEPTPSPQRGYEIWVRDADLVAAAKQHDKIVAVTVLAIHNDPATGALKRLTVAKEEFDCGQGQVRSVSENEIVDGKSRRTQSDPEDWKYLMPHTFRAWAYPAICQGSKFDDHQLAKDVDAALEIQRGFDRDFAAGK